MSEKMFREARVQMGWYLSGIIQQKKSDKILLSKKAGLSQEQLENILHGKMDYPMDHFLKLLTAMDCYFMITDKNGKIINPE
jgi:hypothetical protein